MLIIDGIEYDGVACYLDGLQEQFSLVEGFGAQRLQNGRVWYDILGTETSHTLTIKRGDLPIDKWEELWSVLKQPVRYHSFTLPNGNGEITYDGHIASGSRSLDLQIGGNNYWGDYSIVIQPATWQEEAV